ncbi:Rieske 2Fe-2S domain-containing protein [Actinomadura sp. WMMB 499]|uniref:Rieske (2Fe-2S) protein n=1 Tax=Actinomadura sp. WMMB 499 TaxID=1219491 RepID=UPI00124602DA|nr:Rieske 2Fe-2S domain-containing protein [Actinomadura sp. WMMB 499]QFG25028.1 Rieske 2Fe-2S domain-containing protein [Actinomadura sp. WMMB 499]
MTDVEYRYVARSGQVPEGVVRRFFVDGGEAGEVEIALARSEGVVHAMSNYCTHLDCLLSSGRVTEDGLLCSCHGSVFDYADGEPITPPATRPVQVYPVKEEDGRVLVAVPPGARPPGPRRRRHQGVG